MKGFSWRVSSCVQVPAIEYSSRHRRGSVTWLDGGGGRSSPHKRRTRAPGVIGSDAGVHRRLVTTAVGLTLAANAGPPAMRYPAISVAPRLVSVPAHPLLPLGVFRQTEAENGRRPMESISQGPPISEVKGVPLLQGTPTLRTRSSSPSESSCIAQHDWQVRSVSA